MKLYKQLLPILAIIIGVAVLMLFLHFKVARPGMSKNGFVRTQMTTATMVNKIVAPSALVNVAGIRNDSVYFGTREPGKLVVAGPQLQDPHYFHFPVTDTSHRVASNFRTIIQQEKLYTVATNVPALMVYELKGKKETVYAIDRSFANGVILPGGDLITRSADASRYNQVIRKIDPITGISQEDDHIIPRLNDGGFATDGIIHYDAVHHNIQYIHFYSNKVLVLDTNLNLLVQHKTIDTFSQYQARGQARKKGSATSFGFAEPPRAINAHSQIDNGKLYVMSWLRADNESDEQFGNHSVIDVYDAGTGHYTTSVYIPKVGKKTVFHFYVSGNNLWTLYGTGEVAQYRIGS